MFVFTRTTAVAIVMLILLDPRKDIIKKRPSGRPRILHPKPSKPLIPAAQHLLKATILPIKALDPLKACLNKVLPTSLVNIESVALV